MINTQGDIIASLDQKEALLKLEYAKIELEKQTKLFELGSIVETKLKQSQLEYQSAKAELDMKTTGLPAETICREAMLAVARAAHEQR